MSASRESKTRQVTNKKMSEKQLRALRAKQKAKRNAITYSVVGAVCAVLAAALLIWNSGFFQARASVMTIGGKGYSVAELQYYYGEILNEWYAYAESGMLDLDFTQPLQDQMYDDTQSWHDIAIDSAVQNLVQNKVLYLDAVANGYELSEENTKAAEEQYLAIQTEALNAGYVDFAQYIKTCYGKYMTEKIHKRMYMEVTIANQYAQDYYDAQNYTDDEVEQYYAENEDDLDLYYFAQVHFDGSTEPVTDADGNTITPSDREVSQYMGEAKRKALTLESALKKGTSYEDAVAAYEEDSRVTVYKLLGHAGNSISTLFQEWVKDENRQEGDVTILENTMGDGYYVVYFSKRCRDEEISRDVRQIYIAAEMNTNATEPTEEQYEAARVKAEELLENWKKANGTEETFAELAKTESNDEYTAAEGGLLEQVTTTNTYNPDMANWVVDPARQYGDTAIFKNTGSQKGYFILYYLQENEPLWKIDTRHTLRQNATNDWIGALMEEAEPTRRGGLKYVGLNT